MIGAGSYALSAAALAALLAALAFAAFRLRARLMPAWDGAPARLVEAVVGVALLIWIAELLGVFGLLYAWTLLLSSLVLAAGIAWWSRPLPAAPPPTSDRTRGPGAIELLAMVGVLALVVAHWGITTDSALGRGMFNFDSLWYHMPFAADIAQSHSVTGLHRTETVFTNWLYPQNSELLHAVGILFAERDTLSLFVNFGWLAIAFLAAWCVGRPYGRGHLSVVAVAILLECHTLVVREPGAAKNDVVVAALVLAAMAILVNAWAARDERGEEGGPPAGDSLPTGWPLAAAGLAVGLAAGTKFTVFAMAAALSLAVVMLAPAGRRGAAAAWWFLPALAGGGFWYLRNLFAAGNPLPEISGIGPLDLPHPEGLQTARPDFDIAHYATDTRVWTEYFTPGLHDAFGFLWPVVVLAALLGAGAALLRGRDRVLRWMGGAALFGIVAYLFTPLSAAGAEGEPEAFAINIRYVVPAMLAALALLPLARAFDQPRRQWALLGALLCVLVVTDRSDAVLRDPSRVFAVLLALCLVLVPACLLLLRGRGATAAAGAGLAALALAIVAIGYPVQRDYLGDRFANRGAAEESIPGMGLDGAYRWARETSGLRIGLAGTTAGFLQYGFYGTDLSNRVVYLGEEGPDGAFNAIPDCRGFRAAVNDAELDYLITAPFLNFIDPERPVASPEAGWLRLERAVRPVLRSGRATVWRVEGALDPAGCGPANEPLRSVPDVAAD